MKTLVWRQYVDETGAAYKNGPDSTDPELRYLRAFWGYVTEDLTLKELRDTNLHIEDIANVPVPKEYSI